MKILLVDDDRKNIALMKAKLEKLGSTFATALNGREALEKVLSFGPDLILLDVMLPELDGFEVCRRLKADPETQHIPVIMVTSYDDREARLKGLDVGAEDFLARPVAGDELLARVRNFLKIKEYQNEITAKNSELDRLNTLKRELVDMIVHDLKGPLTCIQGYIQLADVAGRQEKEARREYLARADQSCDALLAMVNALLDISRMEEGKMPLTKTTIAVADLFHRVRNMFIASAENEGKQLVIEALPTLTIAADAELLERVLQNLVANALRHVEDGRGEVRLAVQKGEEEHRFSVADNGRGIPVDFQQKIFEKYEQGGKNPSGMAPGRRGMNKGLGLTFCKLAVEAHGGEIWVESATGKGSIFHFSLPVGAIHESPGL